MIRTLAIDYGTKRIGLATTDALGITIQPQPFLINTPTVFQKIKEIVEVKEIKKIIIGMPYSLKGGEGTLGQEIRQFKDSLEQILVEYPVIKIEFFNEQYTSKIAEKALIKQNYSRKKRKKKIDSIAAYYLLENYLKHNQKLDSNQSFKLGDDKN